MRFAVEGEANVKGVSGSIGETSDRKGRDGANHVIYTTACLCGKGV